jgi:helicase SWR1
MSAELQGRRQSRRLRNAAEIPKTPVEEMPNKRRKSGRVHTPVNYSLSKSRDGPKKTDHGRVIKKDGVSYVEDSEGLQRHKEEQQQLTGMDLLGKLSAKHQLLTSELFHLQQFTSLVTWDPQAAPSKFYQDFVEEEYNLWKEPQKKDSEIPTDNATRPRKSRHSSRVTVNPLKSFVEDSETKFIDEVLNPSKYYHDHFLTTKGTGRTKSKPYIIQPSTPSPTKTARLPPMSSKRSTGTKEKLGSRPSSSRAKRARTDSDDESEEEQEEDYSSSVEEGEVSEDEFDSLPLFSKDRSVPKLKLKLGPPKPTITAPEHIGKPEFDSLESYLQSYRSLDEDLTPEEFEHYVEEQREFIEKLERAVDNNVLTIDNEFNISKVPPPRRFRDPLKNQHTYHDHLVGQAIHLSKLLGDSKKAKIQRARKVAQMVEGHFKREAGAEERARKEEERRLKALARNAVQAVKKRWTLAEKAYRILKKQEAEELKRIKGKEHLSQMLEHSTQLLEAQLSKQSDEEGDVDGADLLSEGDMDGDQFQNVDDSELTVEQLKAKYGHLQDMGFDELSEVTERETTAQEETEKDETPIELTQKERDAVEADGNADHNSLLDSDTSLSSESDSDMDESSEYDSETVEDSRPNGLASLFDTASKDDDDDNEYSNDENDVISSDDDRESDKESSKASPEEPTKEISTPSSTPDVEKTNDSKVSRATSAEPGDSGVVDVPIPDLLLRGNLRYYQKQGLNWLASLYNNHTNGILADEMGLGKTIQTISLICYLAVFKGIWGPHLIVVPTSVLLNWEMEFKRFAPGFKLMVYYGSPQQRKEKRKGWNKPDTFHVCITSYQLVCQDQQIFKRKKWRYMILDEAHNIKNFKSNRWNALLNFNTENRLLLTGTPLQNNIMELWSLLYFLMPSSKANQAMPSGFANLEDFQQWFGKPVDKIIEGGSNQEVDAESKKTVAKLHQVLRPYLLRRLKADVESQMPGKYEHVVVCRLSKRQYKLYHEYLARSDTKDMLKNANYISIINCLMQLRKVCNHPDLFEERPILTSFAIPTSVVSSYETTNSVVLRLLRAKDNETRVDLDVLNLKFAVFEKQGLNSFHSTAIQKLKSSSQLQNQIDVLSSQITQDLVPNYSSIHDFYDYTSYNQKKELLSHLEQILYLNNLRCDKTPVYGANLLDTLNVFTPIRLEVSHGEELMKPLTSRILSMQDKVDRFAFVTPAVVTLNMKKLAVSQELANELTSNDCPLENPFHKAQTKLSIQFPDKSFLLYDCGKLQKLSKLLQQLKDGGHRALIFTQMTKVLDILEQFLNIMGIRYMRLDGATKIEDRQILTERFNTDPKIMVFILSTRSGGLGINLTGADTVIFYDSDWNPAMDKQCQDRCHRIGQTRDVHIYRFVSEYTIESNILKKANQKRHLDSVVIQEGEFTTDYFSKLSVKDLLGDEAGDDLDDSKPLFGDSAKLGNVLAQAEDETDARAAKEAMKEVNLDDIDFDENATDEQKKGEDEFGQDDEGVGHCDEYMIRFIANGYYYD